MRFRSLRGAMLVGALVVACSSSDDDDDGCSIGERRCAEDRDCDGFAPPDFAILGPPIDPRCFRTECIAEKCKATPLPGRREDDADGDCQKSTCSEEGRLELTPDPSDPPSSEGLEPCQRHVCETGFFGGLGPVTRPAPEGVTCSRGNELGTCSAGRCVGDVPVEASFDAATDAGADAETDGSTDASDDAPTDASPD